MTEMLPVLRRAHPEHVSGHVRCGQRLDDRATGARFEQLSGVTAAVLGGTVEPPFGVVAVGPDALCFVHHLYGDGVPPQRRVAT